jgi:beta-lactamase regulating signal transducer with metallopeptidase domain
MIHAFMNTDAFGGLMTLMAVSALIVLILMIRRPIAKRFGAQVAYCLWLIPFARLAIPPLPDAWTLGSAALTPSARSVTDIALQQTHAAPSNTAFQHVTIAAPADIAPLLGANSSAAAGPSLWISISIGLLAVWGIGALFLTARGILRQRAYLKIIHSDLIAPSDDLTHMAMTLAKQIGLSRTPQVALSLVTSGPIVTGLARPIVLLPAWFEQDYTPSEQRAAIAHELTHVKRGDLWAIQLSEIFVAALWFNPLAYIARRSFRCDQEAACDSDVLRSGAATPHQYGSTLIKAVRLSQGDKTPAFAAGLPHNNEIKQRLVLIAAPVPSTRKRLAGTGLTALAGAAALLLTATTAIAHPAPDGELEGAVDGPTVHGITLDGHTIHINGKKVEGRKFELLSDPFEDVGPNDAEMKRIDEITHNNKAAFMDTMPPMPPAPMPPDFDVHEQLALDSGANAESHAASIEEWATEYETKMQVWEASYGASMREWETKYDARIKEWEAKHSTQTHEWEEQLESEIRSVFDQAFEDRIEDASDTLNRLIYQCKDADLGVDEEQVFEQARGDGKIFKIKCTGTDA